MKCGLDEIIEGLGRKEATNEWDGDWNIASRFISNVQQWEGPIVDRRRCDRVTCPTTTRPIVDSTSLDHHQHSYLLPRASDQLGTPHPIPSW